MEIIIQSEALILSAMRAIYWPGRKSLILADLHLGKAGYFRSNGIPIPSTVMVDDLLRLSSLIDTYQPEKLIVAGDMFHHDYNADIAYFGNWRKQYAHIEFVLVPGNHDKLLRIDYEALQIRVTEKVYQVAPFTVVHEPGAAEGGFTLSGHLHPGYTMTGKARQALRLPCFIVKPQQIILPAFSSFTGLYTGYAESASDCYYLIGGDNIFKV